ncbi:hypothetical protein ACIQUM_33880 [Amycolatopsis azurea]|uniref:hypothetical protein n=1 Tax=Amycolatopsis azurea TaxID=36819 RepID=UPI0037FBD858
MTSPQGAGAVSSTGQITPLFAMVFIAALGITILSGIGMVVLLLQTKDLPATSTLSDVFKMGVAAVLGLIGGKAASDN